MQVDRQSGCEAIEQNPRGVDRQSGCEAIEQNPRAVTVIPRGTRVDGLVEADHDLTVEGRVDGRIEVGGTLIVAAGATCRASLRARHVRIAGEVIGDVVCSSSVAVLAGGRVVGDLRAPEIEVDADAKVDGRVDLLPPAPRAAPLERLEMTARGPGVRRPSPPLPVTQIHDDQRPR